MTASTDDDTLKSPKKRANERHIQWPAREKDLTTVHIVENWKKYNILEKKADRSQSPFGPGPYAVQGK